MKGKTVAESQVLMQYAPMPNDTNIGGTMHGGNLLKLIDTAGGIAASRHARSRIVTASLERLDFLAPINLGELVTLNARVNMVGRTSIDVSVYVDSENLLSGEQKRVAECFLTFVSIDRQGRPIEVPPLIISNEEEQRSLEAAQERRRYRNQLLQRPGS